MQNVSVNAATLRVRMAARLLRAVPSGVRGRWRLGRAILGSDISLENVRITSLAGNVFLVPCLQEPVAFSLLVDGTYEPETLALINSLMPADGAFVDIGANIGLFAVEVAKKMGGRGHVLAIEASPTVFRYLRSNVDACGLSNVRVENIAVNSGDSDHTDFYEAPVSSFGMGARAPQFYAPATTLPAASLDEILSRTGFPLPRVIKIDVEGFEADVFRGGLKCLSAAQAPAVIFEFVDWAEARSGGVVGEAQRLLLDLGYQLQVIESGEKFSAPLRGPLMEGAAMLLARRT